MILNPNRKAAVGKPRVSRKGTPVDEMRLAAEVRTYFERRRSRLKIVKTTRTPSGQILDWVPIETQVPDGKIASPPPSPPMAILQGERHYAVVTFELEDDRVERGPRGTVPVLAKDFSKLHISRSLRDYLSRHGHARRRFLELKNGLLLPDPEEGGTHRYAFTSEATLADY